MKQELLKAIAAKIREYDSIMIFRHIRMDGDCVGASKGLKEILKLTYPEKTVLLVDSQKSEYLGFLPQDDDETADGVYRKSLAVVVDTADRDRI